MTEMEKFDERTQRHVSIVLDFVGDWIGVVGLTLAASVLLALIVFMSVRLAGDIFGRD